MTTARDTHNQIEYAKEITREEERKAIAINLIQLGTPCEIVAKATGLSLEEVTKLKESL
jgi:predicted HTH domain antitoxin